LASYWPTEHDRAETWPLLVIGAAGLVAQRKYLGASAATFEYLGGSDEQQSRDIAAVVTETAGEALGLLNMARSEARWIVDHGWDRILRLAVELGLRGKLDQGAIKEILEEPASVRRRKAWAQLTERVQAAGLVLSPRGVDNPSASSGRSNGRAWARTASGISPSGVVTAAWRITTLFLPYPSVSRSP
jgi:hypothetical protein